MSFFEKRPTGRSVNGPIEVRRGDLIFSFDPNTTQAEIDEVIRQYDADTQSHHEQGVPQLSKRQEALTRMADERGITLPAWLKILDRPDVSKLPDIYSAQQKQIENQLMNQFGRYGFIDTDAFIDAVTNKEVTYSNPGEYEEAMISCFGPVRSKSFTVGVQLETNDGPDYQELDVRRLEFILGHDNTGSVVDTHNLYMVNDVKKQMKAIFDEISPVVAPEAVSDFGGVNDPVTFAHSLMGVVMNANRGQLQAPVTENQPSSASERPSFGHVEIEQGSQSSGQAEIVEDKPDAITFKMPRVLRCPNLHLSRTKVLGASGLVAALAIGWQITGDDAPEMSPETRELSAALYENEAALPPHTFTTSGKAYVGTQIKDGWLPQGTPEEVPEELAPYVENYTMSFDDGKWGIDFEATNGAFTVAPDEGKHLVTVDPEKFETAVTDLQTESDAKSSVVKEAASITNEEVATLQKYVSDRRIYDTFDAKDIVSANQAMGNMTAADVSALGESAVLSKIEQQFRDGLTEDFQKDVEQYVDIVGKKLNISSDDITVEIKDDSNLPINEDLSNEPTTSGAYRLSGVDAISIKEQDNE